jgi:hypothetical protein
MAKARFLTLARGASAAFHITRLRGHAAVRPNFDRGETLARAGEQSTAARGRVPGVSAAQLQVIPSHFADFARASTETNAATPLARAMARRARHP